jgi:outer membrane protein OmpA-like peptidoglycan-associated protein
MPARNFNQEIIMVNGENRLNAAISAITLSPCVAYDFGDDIIDRPFRIFMAVDIYDYFIEKKFDQTEEIVSPDNAYFIQDGVRTQSRMISSGEFATLNNIPAILIAGMEVYSPAGENFAVTSKISFGYRLNDYLSDADWKSFSVNLGVGIRYSFRHVADPPQPAPIPNMPLPPVEEMPIELTEEIYAEVMNSDMEIHTGMELISTQPVVNSVFFAENSSDIPAGYSLKMSAVELDTDPDPLELHNNILPIIAELMESNPDSDVILTGYTSGSESEDEDIQLAWKRAEEIKLALVNLGIQSDRINTGASELPEYPSNVAFDKGAEENRRVDIKLRNVPLQEFTERRNFERLVGNIETMVRYKNIPRQIPVMLSCSHADTIIICKYPGIYNVSVNKRINQQFDNEIILRASAADNHARDTLKIRRNSLPVKEIDLDLSRFVAFLRFDYNQSSLSAANQRLLAQLADRLSAGTTIRILGGTDRLGTEESNRELAMLRARAVRDYILSKTNKAFEFEIGINQKKFPEDSPQGRFLNRSVKIELSE